MSSKNEILNERLAKRGVSENVFVKSIWEGEQGKVGGDDVRNFEYFYTLKLGRKKVLNAILKACSLGCLFTLPLAQRMFWTFSLSTSTSKIPPQRSTLFKRKKLFPYFQKNEKLISTYIIGFYVFIAKLERNNLFLSCIGRKVEISFALVQWKQIKRIKEVINQWVLKHLFSGAAKLLQSLLLVFPERRTDEEKCRETKKFNNQDCLHWKIFLSSSICWLNPNWFKSRLCTLASSIMQFSESFFEFNVLSVTCR